VSKATSTLAANIQKEAAEHTVRNCFAAAILNVLDGQLNSERRRQHYER